MAWFSGMRTLLGSKNKGTQLASIDNVIYANDAISIANKCLKMLFCANVVRG